MRGVVLASFLLGPCGACGLPCDRTIEGTLLESPVLAAHSDAGYLVTWWLRGENEGTWARSADTTGTWSEARQLESGKLVKLVGSGDRYLAGDYDGVATILDSTGTVLAQVAGPESFKAATAMPGGWLALHADAQGAGGGTLYVSRVMFDGQRTSPEMITSNASSELAALFELNGTFWVIFTVGIDMNATVKAIRYSADGTRMDVEPLQLAQFSTLLGAYSIGTKALVEIRQTSFSLYFLGADGRLSPVPAPNEMAASRIYTAVPGSGFLGGDYRNTVRWYDLDAAPLNPLATGDGNSGLVAIGAPGSALVLTTGGDGGFEKAETNSWLDGANVPFGQGTYVSEFRETERYYDDGPCLHE